MGSPAEKNLWSRSAKRSWPPQWNQETPGITNATCPENPVC